MALAVGDFTTLVDAKDDTDLDSYTFGLSAALTASELGLAAIRAQNVQNADPPTPDVTLSGITMSLEVNISVSSFQRSWFFRCLDASPSGTNIVIDFGGDDMTSCAVEVENVANINTGGTNGADAVVQSGGTLATGTAPSHTLASFADAVNNATFGCVMTYSGATAVTAGSGFTLIGDSSMGDHVECEAQAGEDTTVDFSFSASQTHITYAAEIAEAVSGIITELLQLPHHMRAGFNRLHGGFSA